MVVGETLKGIRRTIGTAQKGKDPLLTADIRKIVERLSGQFAWIAGPGTHSDRVSPAASDDRSSHSIQVSELTFGKFGVTVDVPTSKTDQEGEGRKVGLPFGAHPETCPVRALRAWLTAAGIKEGAVFRRVNRYGQIGKRALYRDSIGTILKRAVRRAHMKTKPIAGHSLRSGMVTQAAMNGVSEFVIMKQSGHRTVASLKRYVRFGRIFTENAAASLGI